MYISVSKTVSSMFRQAMERQKIYVTCSTVCEDQSRLIFFVDCSTLREAFYVGRWIGRNLDTSEAVFIANIDNNEVRMEY